MTPALRWLGRLLLKVAGWRIEGEAPTTPRYVLIAAPHTSNWDLVLMLLCGMAFGIWPSWVGKDTLFRPPFGFLLRALRGIPVDRRSPQNRVEQLAALFGTRERLVLAIPPEGTRSSGERWRSGFYFVARAASVPVCLGYLDYSRKRGGLGPMLVPTGDLGADMDVVRAFYADKRGRFPEKQGPIRLAAEDPS
jgi:1-acyl-sn-glycerol-3-phosphate acyltransferase